MKKILFIILVLGLLVAGCSNPSRYEVLRSNQQQSPVPVASGCSVAEGIAENNHIFVNYRPLM